MAMDSAWGLIVNLDRVNVTSSHHAAVNDPTLVKYHVVTGQLRRGSRNRLGSGNDDPPRDDCSDSNGLGWDAIGGGFGGAWLEATSVAASGRSNRGDKVQIESGPVLARMTFDKDNPTHRPSGVPGL